MLYFKKEERWALRYAVQKDDGSLEEKVCYPRCKEKLNSNKEKCKKLGYKIISCNKLYPFSTEKNQHNFELINNICRNRIYDMNAGIIPYDSKEYERLSELAEKAEKFFCYELPVAWVTWEEHCEMKELASMAVIHRQNACIEAGRPDLVTYC